MGAPCVPSSRRLPEPSCSGPLRGDGSFEFTKLLAGILFSMRSEANEKLPWRPI